jgi:hypothetical protein
MDAFVERIRRPMLRRVYEYWQVQRRGRELPSRSDIDPLDLGFALGNITLIDVLYDPLRFRYRLHGSVIVERVGIDMTGKLVDEVAEPERRAFILENYRTVVATRQPLARHGRRTLDQRQWNFNSITLPFANEAGVIDILMICVEYHRD